MGPGFLHACYNIVQSTVGQQDHENNTVQIQVVIASDDVSRRPLTHIS